MKFPEIVVHGVALNPALAEDRARIAELKTAAIRMRNFGTAVSGIADVLGLSEDAAEHLISTGLRELIADDAESVRARQQAVLNDIKRAMYPTMAQGDQGAAGVILRVLDHEAKINHGVAAPTRVRVGIDQEEFATRVDEDIAALGVHPRMDVGLIEDDEPWANT